MSTAIGRIIFEHDGISVSRQGRCGATGDDGRYRSRRGWDNEDFRERCPGSPMGQRPACAAAIPMLDNETLFTLGTVRCRTRCGADGRDLDDCALKAFLRRPSRGGDPEATRSDELL